MTAGVLSFNVFDIKQAAKDATLKMSDEQFFTSKPVRNYLESTAKNMLGKKLWKKCPVTIEVYWNPSADEAAYTTGRKVVINMATHLLDGCNRYERLCGIIGLICHEIGHILYTDLERWNKESSINRVGNWTKPVYRNADEITDLLGQYPNFRRFFANIRHDICNVAEDVYEENRLLEKYSGIYGLGLRSNAKRVTGFFTVSSNYDSLIKNSKSKESLELTIMRNAFFVNFRGFNWKAGLENESREEVLDLADRIQDTLNEMETFIDDLLWQPNSEVRTREINSLMCILYDWMPKPEDQDNQQNQQSQNKEGDSSENGDSSQNGNGGSSQSQNQSGSQSGNQKQDISDELADSSEDMADSNGNGVKVPQGYSTPVDSSEPDRIQGKEAVSKADSLLEKTDAQEREFSAIEQNLKAEIEKMEAEKGMQDAQKQEANDIQQSCRMKFPKTGNLDWRYNVNRSIDPSQSDIDQYQADMEVVGELASSASRQIERILTLRQRTGSSRGKEHGRFDTRSYIRNKNIAGSIGYFREKKVPNGQPKVCFAIRIDESGSMRGENASSARQAAIAINEILTKVGIPHLIIGDTTGISTTELSLYHDFDEVDGKDKFRLGGINAYHSNRDGAAIAYCAEKLLKRPETKKVLLSISDGMPSDESFTDLDPMEDTMAIVDTYRKKGIEVTGVAIDFGSLSSIRRIYGEDSTMDLSDLSKLSIELVAFIKRHVLN